MPVGSPLVNLQTKTTVEVLRQFEEAFAASECSTKGQFMEAILETYLNPPKGKTVEVSSQEDQQTIELQANEIGRLKILIDQKDEALDRASNLYIEVGTRLKKAEETPIFNADQILVTIPPIIGKVLEIEAITAKKKTGKDFTIGEILVNSLWESVTVGRVYPWRAWSSSELSDLAKQLKAAE